MIELQRRYDPCYGAPAIPKCNKGQLYSPLLPLPLKEDVDEETVTFLLERSEDFPGVRSSSSGSGCTRTRRWPATSSATWARSPRRRRTSTSGLQRRRARRPVRRRAEHGRRAARPWGKKVYEIDAAGNIVGEDVDQEVAPVAGQDIQLSIDLDVQQYAEQALQTELRNRRNLPTDLAASRRRRATTRSIRRPELQARVYASSKEFGNQEWIPFKAPAGAVVVEDYSTGQILAMASYPTFDNRWMGDDRRREVRPAVPDKIDPITARPRQVDPRQPRDPGPVQHGLVVQAVHRLVGDARRDHRPDEPLQRPGHLQAGIDRPEDVCQHNGGTSAASSRTPATSRHQPPSTYGPRHGADALAGQQRRVLLPDRREVLRDGRAQRLVDPVATWQVDVKDDLQPFGFGTKTGIQLPFECSGRMPDTPIKKELIDTGSSARTRCPTRRRRQRAGGHRPGPAGGHAAAGGQRATRRSPTAASCCSRRSSRRSTRRSTPNSSPGGGRPVQGTRRAVVRRRRRSRTSWRCRPTTRDPIVAGLKRVINADRVATGRQLPEDLLPRHHRRESLRDLPRAHADRRQDRDGTGRRRLSVERLVGVRRVQHRRHQPYTVSPTSRRPATAPRPPRRWSSACSSRCPA